MNAKQTKLIEQAATVETDGEGWRKRMERWLDEKCVTWLKLSPASVIGKGTRITVTYTQP